MQQEYGRAYLNRLRTRYPDVPGRADYCVFWFRRAHDELPTGGRAGLVGTNTIRQNYSREGGLDYIVENGGVITEAVSSQVWSGEAAVHVSIVNWLKGYDMGKKKLYNQLGDNRDSPWEVAELDWINSSLSPRVDTTSAKRLSVNIESGACYQGQTHGHDGFLLAPGEARKLIQASARNSDVIFPYLTINDILIHNPPLPQRYIIDFHPRDVISSAKYSEPLKRVKELVLADRQSAAKIETIRNEEALDDNPNSRVNKHHENFLKRWWLISYPRKELIEKIATLPRYIACGRVTKRPIFEFIDSSIRPGDSLQVFSLADDYSFGILQSNTHWGWFTEKCSTLTRRFRYTSDTVFDTFPWPQSPSEKKVRDVANAAKALYQLRAKILAEGDLNLRELYRLLELEGDNPLKKTHRALDDAVRVAYGISLTGDVLQFLLTLNLDLAEKERKGNAIVGPGLPNFIVDPDSFVTDYCIRSTQL